MHVKTCAKVGSDNILHCALADCHVLIWRGQVRLDKSEVRSEVWIRIEGDERSSLVFRLRYYDKYR